MVSIYEKKENEKKKRKEKKRIKLKKESVALVSCPVGHSVVVDLKVCPGVQFSSQVHHCSLTKHCSTIYFAYHNRYGFSYYYELRLISILALSHALCMCDEIFFFCFNVKIFQKNERERSN